MGRGGGADRNFPFFPDLDRKAGRAINMAKRWSAEDIRDLKTLAQKHSVQGIAEKMDRTVGGVAFKAHQLGLRLKARSGVTDPEPMDFSWTANGDRPPCV